MQVCVHRFHKTYAVPFSKSVEAVQDLSFAVGVGECFALLGVNGAGKSTTFKALTNDITTTSGQVLIQGKDLAANFDEARHQIGYCPQHHALFAGLTAKEHLEFYAAIKSLPPGEFTNSVIEEVITTLDLEAHQHKLSEQLSGGNKRKLQLAIALLGYPSIILLDEPSAGMDPAAKHFMWEVISAIPREQPDTSVILTTHSMQEAEKLSHRIGIMGHGGRFQCFGTPQHIKRKLGHGFEIEVKLRTPEDQVIEKLAQSLLEQNLAQVATGTSSVYKPTVLLSLLKERLPSSEPLAPDLEELILEELATDDSPVESGKPAQAVAHCLLTPFDFTKAFLICHINHSVAQEIEKESGHRPSISESYAGKYLRLFVDQAEQSEQVTQGYLLGVMEQVSERIGQWATGSSSQGAWSLSTDAPVIEDYQVSLIGLDAIFQKLQGNQDDEVEQED